MISLINSCSKSLLKLLAILLLSPAFSWAQNVVEVSPVGSGKVTGTGTFQTGSTIQISATPDPGFEFIGWSGDLAGKENPYSFSVKSAIAAFAHFEKTQSKIIYIDGQPAIAGSFVAKLNENGRRSLRRRVNRVENTTVFRRNKVLDDLVKIDWDPDAKLSDKVSDANLSSETLQQFSGDQSSFKSSGVTREIKDMLQTNYYEFVEPNWVVSSLAPQDSNFVLNKGGHWGLRNTGQDGFYKLLNKKVLSGTVGLDVEADEAWEKIGNKEGPIVAVIDSGVDYTHADLKQVMWVNSGEIAGNNKDDDSNGFIDDIYGIYALKNNDSGNPMDENGHGSHVAGIISANGAKRSLGVAWNSKIMALRFMDAKGRGSLDDSVRCIDYAILMGAKIINASYGGYATSPDQRRVERDAIERAQAKGILIVAAAGNDGRNNDSSKRMYPASHVQKNIISVAAVDRNGKLADFSNFGATQVDLGAPGVEIFAPVPKTHGWKNGTSMAAPFVSGAAALLLTLNPELTHEEIKDSLLSNVTPLASLSAKTVSGGMLNVNQALTPPTVAPITLDVTYSPNIPETGKPIDIVVKVTGPGPVLNANISATLGKKKSYDLLDNGANADKTAGDGIYSMQVYTPELPTFDLKISVNAPDREVAEKVFRVSTITRPQNDHFSTALPLDSSQVSTKGTNLHATLEKNEPTFESAIDRTVWYSWRPNQAGEASLSTFGSSFDTTLAVYQGEELSKLSLIGSNDDANKKQLGSEVVFEAVKDALYYIQVGGKLKANGEIILNHPQPKKPEPEILRPVILSNSKQMTRVEGENLVLETEIGGTAPFSIRWFKDGQLLPQARQSTLYLQNLKVSDSGQYSLQVSNDAGDAKSDLLHLKVEPKLDISLKANILPQAPERLKSFSLKVQATTNQGSLLDANLQASLNGAPPVSLLDNGTGPDEKAKDGVYSTNLPAPNSSTFVISISASAPGTETARLERSFETIQRPANDTFAGAHLLNNDQHITQADNSLATLETSEPRFLDTISNTLWFKWAPQNEGIARLSTKGSLPDTTLAVYTGTAIDALSLVSSNDNFEGNSRHAEVVFKAKSGTQYLLQVGSKSQKGGSIRLHHPAPKKEVPKIIPPKILTQPSELSKTEGDPLSISVKATGSAPLAYQWYLNKRILPGATQSTYVSTLLGVKDGGVYSVKVSNGAGNATLGVLNLTVRPSRESAPNDMVENAHPINGNAARFTTITRNATGQPNEPNHAGQSTPLHSVWWKWTAPKSGEVRLSTAGSSFDTTLAAYELLDDSENRRATDSGILISSFTPAADGKDLLVTLEGHGLPNGQIVQVSGITGYLSSEANFLISVRDANSFYLSGTATIENFSLSSNSTVKKAK